MAVPTEDGSVFRCFSSAGLLPFREAPQLPCERIIIALTTNLSPAITRGIINVPIRLVFDFVQCIICNNPEVLTFLQGIHVSCTFS